MSGSMRLSWISVALCGTASLLFAACVTQANLPPGVTIEKIRQVKVGMSRREVEVILGSPLGTEVRDRQLSGEGAETLVYSRRMSRLFRYSMLWVHLRNGRVESVYGRRYNPLDSGGVYASSAGSHWEREDFTEVFPRTRE
jgi:hypothetical protein